MPNPAQKSTFAIALMIAAAMRLYPPFADVSVHLPEPIYAPFNKPPLGANDGSIAIVWEVLIVQWVIVFTVALGLCVTFRAGNPLSPMQTATLWVGIAATVTMLLLPPYKIGVGGPFGFPCLQFKPLFLPKSYATMEQSLLAAEIIIAVFMTTGATALAGRRASGRRQGML